MSAVPSEELARALLWRFTFGREGLPPGDYVAMLLDLVGKSDPFNQNRILRAFPELYGPWMAFKIEDADEARAQLVRIARMPAMPSNDRSEWRARGTVQP